MLMNNNLPLELQNIIFSYARPVYPHVKELKEKVKKYIKFHKGFSKTLLGWAKENKECGNKEEYLDYMRMYKNTLDNVNLNTNIKVYHFIGLNI